MQYVYLVIIILLLIIVIIFIFLPYLKKIRERVNNSEQEIENNRIDLSWQTNLILAKAGYNEMRRIQARLISKLKDDLHATLVANNEISASKIHQLFLALDNSHESNGYVSPLLIESLEKAIVEYLLIHPGESKLQNIAVIYTDSDSLGFEYKFLVKVIDRIMAENQLVTKYNELFKELVREEIKKRAEG